MSFRRAGCLAVLAVASALFLKVDVAGSITIRPAEFDHIVADVPREVMAGVEFEVGVTFVDRFGNPMEESWKPDSSLTLIVSQPATVKPSILTPGNYTPGFRYSVHTEKMGRLTLSLRDDRGRILDEWELTIKSGRPAQLLVDVPARAEVGQTVTMSLQAVDAHGNVAYGYEPEMESLVMEDGAASFAGAVVKKPGGVYELPVIFRNHGQRQLALRDRKRGLAGTSAAVNVTPAPLGSFDLETVSEESVAGEDFALTIRALDRYGNPVTDYDSRYKGVRLYAPNAGILPDLVPPASFSDGVAKVAVAMRSAGDYRVTVSEIQSNISGEFGVRVVPAQARTLKVRTPESATAGEPFEVTIISEDQFGNRTSRIPPGSLVKLNSTGRGDLEPDTVKPGEFKDGVAKVMVSYERAESFEIRADLAGPGEGPAGPPQVDGREKARLAAQKAREEAVRARREARLRDKRVTQQLAAPPKPPSAEKPPAGKTAKPQPERKPAPPVKTVPAMKTEPARTPSRSAPVTASRKVLRPGILDNISVTEEDSGARVTFSTNGMTNYNVTTSAKLSRKWIDFEFPDMAVDLPDRIDGGEKIVGEVYVESPSDGGQGVRVSVEILPTRIAYDVYQEGQSLVLKVNRQ